MPWRLPPSVSLQATIDGWAAARKALLADDLVAADEHEREARAELAKVAERIEDWKGEVLRALADLRKAAFPAEARATLQEENAAAVIDAIPSFDPVIPPSTNGYLRSVHEACGAVRRLIVRVGQDISDSASACAAAAGPAHAAEAEQIHEAAEPASRLPADDAIAALRQLREAGGELLAAVKGALPKINASPVDPEEVRGHVDAGRYAAAITSVKKTSVPGMQGMTPIASGSQAQPITRRIPSPEPPLGLGPPAAVRELVLVEQRSVPVEVILARSFRQLALTRLWIGLISAVGLSVVAWVLYRDTWVGSVRDWMGIAAFAFTTDFTADALLDALTRVKKT